MRRGAVLPALVAVAVTAALASVPPGPAAAASSASLVLSSADGAAFDINEYAAGDLTARFTDASGAPTANVVVTYTVADAPFTRPASGQTAPAAQTGQATTDANGVALVKVSFAGFESYAGASSGVYTITASADTDGTAGPSSSDTKAAPLTVRAGQAALRYTGTTPVTRSAGGTDTYPLSLKLPDGTALPGRTVAITYTAGSGGDSALAAQADQPAGTVRTSATAATATTGSTGIVSVAASDPSSPDVAELGARLHAATTTTSGLGNAGAATSPDVTINYAVTTAPAGTVITLTPAAVGRPGAATGKLAVHAFVDSNGDGTQQSGEPADVGLAVDLSADHGFFTDGKPASTPVVGAETGVLTDLGTTQSVITDSKGNAAVQMSIGRDSSFDNDGQVDATVTASCGSVEDTATQGFTSSGPVNGGAVRVAPSHVQANPTAPTRVGDPVSFDVTATDQFGNPVAGVTVAVSDSSASVTENRSSVTTGFPAASFTSTATAPGQVTLTGTWASAPFHTYTSTAGATTNSPRDLVGRTRTSFYVPNLRTATVTVRHRPSRGVVPRFTPVTEVVTVRDVQGQPIAGYGVLFIRTGAGSHSGGGHNGTRVDTNARGQAFYTFVASRSGTVHVAATVQDAAYGCTGVACPRPERTRSVADELRVADVPTTHLRPHIYANDNGPRTDHLKVKAGAPGAGAVVRVFVAGKRIAVGHLNRRGIARFAVRDHNGRARTTYLVKVGSTRHALGGRTQRAIR